MGKKRFLREVVSEMAGCDWKKADALILSGSVLVGEQKRTKPGEKVGMEEKIRIKEPSQYVSRGAYKLLRAIEVFQPVIEGKVCIDGGSSTGGFTEVLLLYGAQKVYAVDCGKNQLDYKLRTHERVVSMEGYKIQELLYASFVPPPVLGVLDVSFTSCLPAIFHFFQQLNLDEAVVLIKPQFEYQRLKKGSELSGHFDGVVRSNEERQKIVQCVCREIRDFGVLLEEPVIESPIRGGNGNIEYLAYLKKR